MNLDKVLSWQMSEGDVEGQGHMDLTQKISDEHQRIADALGLEFYNYAAGNTDLGIGSKTSKGWLDTEYDPTTNTFINTLDGEVV